MAKRGPRDEGPPLWLVILSAVLFTAAVLFVVFFAPTLSVLARQVIYVLISFMFALLLVKGSDAFVKGRIKNMRIYAAGPWAAALIMYLFLVYFVPTADTQNVRFYLQHKGVSLEKDFVIRVRVPRMEEQTQQGHRGGAAIELPSQIESINTLAVDCPGYRLRDEGPYKIEDGAVYLHMAKTESPDPPGPGDVPPPDIVSDKPTREQVAHPADTPLEMVTLMYRNMATRDIELYLLDFSRYYKIIDEKIDGASFWMNFPMEAKDEFEPFSNFVGGTGWHGLVVKDGNGFHYLGTENLFRKKTMYLTISPSKGGYIYELK